MKATGIVRQMDGLGRIVIPMELRRTLNISDGDGLEIFTDGDKIVLRKYMPGCCLCGKIDGLKQLSGKLICTACIEQAVGLLGVR